MFYEPLAITAAALALEAAFGYPAPLFRTLRHPVVWLGSLIAWLDRSLNPPGTRLLGAMALAFLVFLAAGAGWAVTKVPLAAVLLAATLPAQRSLHAHVAAVADALPRGLPAAREAVAHIVGRDPDRLDDAAIARAAIESLAENFADGVVGPALWGALLGLPGMAAYKAVNTADSMLGHRTPRHLRFGWAAARFDDLVNLPVSRLAATWLLLAAALLPGADPRAGWRALRRDAGHHRSPNAGWPEAAMAGALGFRLAGPRSYGGTMVADGWMGDGRAELTAADIRRALALYRLACALQLGTIAALAVTL